MGLQTQEIETNYSVPVAERGRLNKQAQAMLARLQSGRVTNIELATIGLRYSARIDEMRKAGYVVEVVERSAKTGVTVYELQQ